MSNINKSLVRRFYQEVWNRKNLSLLKEMIAPDYIWHEPLAPTDLRGVEQAEQFLTAYFNAFPDYRVVLEDLIAEGNKVAVRWTAYGTHTGKLKGIPPSGRAIVLPGISILQIKDGKFSEYWTSLDNFSLLSELGVFKLPT